jgi:hypothetical protein
MKMNSPAGFGKILNGLFASGFSMPITTWLFLLMSHISGLKIMLTREGFPVVYEIFKGNTFEGHSIIPVVKAFIRKHQVKHFTVVADAAMIGADNIKALVESNIHDIVGA